MTGEHWIVRDSAGKNPRIVTNKGDVAAYCARGNWQVDGPFVPASQLASAVETLDQIDRVLDRGIPDERKLATIRRLVDGTLALPTNGGTDR
jgi:hypothetical protein